MKNGLLAVLTVLAMNFIACYDDASVASYEAYNSGINPSSSSTTAITVYYKNVQWNASPGSINIHYSANNGEWTTAPGMAMAKHTTANDPWLNYASHTVNNASSLRFCFNQNGSWNNNGGSDFTINAPGTYKIENGSVTLLATRAVGDVYFTGVYPDSVLSDMPVSLYKDGVFYMSSKIVWTTTHGIYATFRELPAGSYKAVLENTLNAVLYSGSAVFTVKDGDTYFPSQNVTVTTEAAIASGDIYYNFNQDIYPFHLIGDMTVSLYRNGSTQVYTQKKFSYSPTKPTACRFNNLPAGSYKAVVKETIDGYRYTGEASISVETGKYDFNSVGMNIVKSLADGITVYYKNIQWTATPGAINCHYNTGSGWTAVPGVGMVKHTSQYDTWLDYASIEIPNASALRFCFNQNGAWDSNAGNDYHITGPGVYKIENNRITKVD